MNRKAIKTTYWAVTFLFALLMLMDGIGGITRQPAGIEVMQHLGYPVYVLSIFGMAKIAGALAIFQNKFTTLKEWAYAGFTINFIGAMLSRIYAGDGLGEILFPIIPIAILFLSYFLWKEYKSQKTIRKHNHSLTIQTI